MGILFDLIYVIAALALSPWWARKARSGWGERFGRIESLPPASSDRVLLHAVSVGEVNLIRSLVDRLSQEVEVVVSATTDTGIARATALYASLPNVHVVRYPIDASWSVRRFLNAVKPDAVGLVELELWPNFARACARRGIPMSILNGRLSERSLGRYKLARPVLAKWFRSLAFCAVQDEQYRERFLAAGVPVDSCQVVGSMKWDAAQIADTVEDADQLAAEMGIDRTKPLIVAGSTAPDEHRLLLESTPDDVQLLCAPRKPEWFDQAAADLPGCVRRSNGVVKGESVSRLFLLDTIGELRKAYALADVVVVGRSFGSLFGSDPIEAAALGKPIVIGPAVADFLSIVETMTKAKAIIQTTRAELSGVLASLMHDEAQRQTLGAAAKKCVADQQGATERHAALLLSLLGE